MFGSTERVWFSVFTSVALKSTAVLAVAWLSALLLRRRSAAARHLVWTTAAAAVLALPLLSIWLPPLGVPITAALRPAFANVTYRSMVSVTRGAEDLGSPARIDAGTYRRLVSWRPHWRTSVMLLWSLGAMLGFCQMLMAWAAVRRLRHCAQAFQDRGVCTELSQALGLRHSIDVLETRRGRMPMTVGFLRPAILLPVEAGNWTDERKRIVLMHELAHVRRGDVAAHLLARTALSLYWWNPMVWITWREFLKERERATDDLVLNTGARASEYAGHLLEVARTMQSVPQLAATTVAMARRAELEGRLLAILDSGVNRRKPGRPSKVIAMLAAFVIIAPLAALRAQENQAETTPTDVDATIRVANSQKNYEMLENAAQAAERLRKYDIAQRLLNAAFAIRAQVSTPDHAEYAVGLLELGELAQKRHMTKDAEALYTKASVALGDRPEAAPAFMYLGVAAMAKKDFPQAIDYFQRAQGVDPSQAGRAMMFMAASEQRQNNMAEAEALYKSALAAQPAGFAESAVTMRVYAEFLRKQGRSDEASALDASAAAIRKTTSSPRPALPSDVHRVGQGVSAPAVLQKVDPEYSEEARAVGLDGTVVVSVEIGPDGFGHNARVVQSLGLGLDESALDAISQWHFRPGMKDGQPVTVLATIEVNFRLL
jgi:TonB family protein